MFKGKQIDKVLPKGIWTSISNEDLTAAGGSLRIDDIALPNAEDIATYANAFNVTNNDGDALIVQNLPPNELTHTRHLYLGQADSATTEFGTKLTPGDPFGYSKIFIMTPGGEPIYIDVQGGGGDLTVEPAPGSEDYKQLYAKLRYGVSFTPGGPKVFLDWFVNVDGTEFGLDFSNANTQARVSGIDPADASFRYRVVECVQLDDALKPKSAVENFETIEEVGIPNAANIDDIDAEIQYGEDYTAAETGATPANVGEWYLVSQDQSVNGNQVLEFWLQKRPIEGPVLIGDGETITDPDSFSNGFELLINGVSENRHITTYTVTQETGPPAGYILQVTVANLGYKIKGTGNNRDEFEIRYDCLES